MITPMKRITVYGVNSSRKAVLEALQKSGCVEITRSENECEIASHIDAGERIMQFDRYISAASQAIAILDDVSPEKSGMFSVRKDMSAEKYSMKSAEIQTVGSKAMEIIQLKKNIQENILKIGRETSKLQAIEAWSNLDVPMNTSGTANTEAQLLSFPSELTETQVEEMLGESAKYVYYEIVSSSKDISCIFLVYLKDCSSEINKILRENGFVKPPVGLSHRTPKDKKDNIRQKISALQEENKSIENKIADYAKMRDEIKLFYDHLILRKEKYLNLQNILVTDEAFIIEGYVPAKKTDGIKSLLEKNAVCAVEFDDLSPDDEAPVLLKNNSFVQPVEGITKDYSLPSKRDIDPDSIMSIFYYLFFGMMFSDAGYGLILALAAGYVGFVAKVESGTKQFMRMFFYCGLSTMFWGFMYGSFFGDILITGNNALWLDPVKEPLTVLIFSVALGLIQVTVGLIIKFHIDFRAGDKVSAIFDTGSWILVLLGAAAGICGYVFKVNILTKVGVVIALLGVVMIVLMKGRDKKNPIARLISGVVGLYDITSFVSDLLSYSRLMALGLATGVIGQVVNIMAGLVKGSILGNIFFVLIFIFGHCLNFAINVLGAYVHTNRLQYVEFYSKFYEGGGRAFAPLSMNTKYFNFQEDIKK